MDAFFPDPTVERFTPDLIRLLELSADPLPDGRRIRIHLSLTPFLHSPVIDLTLTDPQGTVCGGTSIVEPFGWKLDLTLHIRSSELLPGLYTLAAVISYPDMGETDHRQVEFVLPPAGDS